MNVIYLVTHSSYDGDYIDEHARAFATRQAADAYAVALQTLANNANDNRDSDSIYWSIDLVNVNEIPFIAENETVTPPKDTTP